MKMSNRVYDVMKWLTVIVLPALSVFYGTVGKIWNLPYTEQIPQTITAISVCLGACLMISSSNYNQEQ